MRNTPFCNHWHVVFLYPFFHIDTIHRKSCLGILFSIYKLSKLPININVMSLTSSTYELCTYKWYFVGTFKYTYYFTQNIFIFKIDREFSQHFRYRATANPFPHPMFDFLFFKFFSFFHVTYLFFWKFWKQFFFYIKIATWDATYGDMSA